jgi:hypothetical protein
MNKQALEFVMELYQVDRVTALQLYWDEIEHMTWLLDKKQESDDAEV